MVGAGGEGEMGRVGVSKAREGPVRLSAVTTRRTPQPPTLTPQPLLTLSHFLHASTGREYYFIEAVSEIDSSDSFSFFFISC